MKRYTITPGATTTAGGKVISASSHGSINGKAGRHNQPYVEFERFEAAYKAAGGTTK